MIDIIFFFIRGSTNSIALVLLYSIASQVRSSCSQDREMAANHLLLFVSALIPKAMASLLTSAIIELSKDENVILNWDHMIFTPVHLFRGKA